MSRSSPFARSLCACQPQIEALPSNHRQKSAHGHQSSCLRRLSRQTAGFGVFEIQTLPVPSNALPIL
jgi:hypothetical protein